MGNTNGPTSSRAHLIQQICDSLFDGEDFKKILGQTKEFTNEEIRNIFDTSYSWKKNPQALFWKLVREKQEEVRNTLQEKSKQSLD